MAWALILPFSALEDRDLCQSLINKCNFSASADERLSVRKFYSCDIEFSHNVCSAHPSYYIMTSFVYCKTMLTRAPGLSDRCCRHNLVAISGGFLWPRINVNSVQSGRQYLIRSSVSLSGSLIYLVIVVKLRLNDIEVSCFILPIPYFFFKKSECKKVCLDIARSIFIIFTMSNINFSLLILLARSISPNLLELTIPNCLISNSLLKTEVAQEWEISSANVFIFLVHHQIAIGGCLVITNIALKPDHTLGIQNSANRNNTLLSVNPLLVQFKTCGCHTPHLALVTWKSPLLLVLVLCLYVQFKLPLKPSHISAHLAVVPDSLMFEPLVLFKTWRRHGSIFAEVTGEDCADRKMNFQLLRVAKFDFASWARHNVWRVNNLCVRFQLSCACKVLLALVTFDRIFCMGRDIVLVHFSQSLRLKTTCVANICSMDFELVPLQRQFGPFVGFWDKVTLITGQFILRFQILLICCLRRAICYMRVEIWHLVERSVTEGTVEDEGGHRFGFHINRRHEGVEGWLNRGSIFPLKGWHLDVQPILRKSWQQEVFSKWQEALQFAVF